MSQLLLDHARRELETCGQFDEDPAYAQSILAAVAAFASYRGHSGGSVGMGISQLTRLLRFENLSALTDNPAEWVDVAEQSGTTLYQSRRNPAAFSTDGGRTYKVNHDPTREVYTSAPYRPRPTPPTPDVPGGPLAHE